MFCIAVPIVVGVGDTAVVDEADRGVNPAYGRAGSAGQSVGLDNAAEWFPSWEAVVEGQELSLRCFA